jgi:hypothetical protein
VTPKARGSRCALCTRPATEAIAPPRRTFARGLDPDDQSFSVTVILPDVLLCDEHAPQVRADGLLVGWCDNERCRTYGEVGAACECGGEYQRLVPSGPRGATT